MTEETIFAAALDKQSAEERSAYLDEACAGDALLRQRVEALLKAHRDAGNFMERPAVEQVAAGVAQSKDSTEAIDTSPQVDDAIAESPVCASPGETQAEGPQRSGDGPSLDFLVLSRKLGCIGRLSHYEVMEVVGQGGMGVVLRAFDEVLHRVVAIKVMASQLATNASARKRFIREAQAAAAIRDEHVVDIHAVEEANGLPYLVMEYVDGMSLQDRLDRSGPLELKEILRIGMQTATGLAKAHAQGLIHRDIKPANILLENGVQRVKITDFGLARAVDDASLTQSGVVAGTPQYMAPEQARGEAVDHRADLFSLGSLLYAMCTGRPPFRASSTMAVLKRVCEDTPRPVREINPDSPAWLAEIIDKLHAKNPAHRFQSAAEVADLLAQHLAHLQRPDSVPLPARIETPVQQSSTPMPVRRWAAAAAVLLFLVGGLGLTEAIGVTRIMPSVIRIVTGEGTLVVEVDDPEVSVTIDGQDLVITGAGPREVRLRPGSYQVRATKDGKPVPVEQNLVTITRGVKEVVRVRREGEIPGQTASQVPALGETRRFEGHKGPVRSVAFSPDGRYALSGSGWPQGDRTMRLWNVASGREVRRFLGHKDQVHAVAFSPDGRRALSGSFDQTMRLWDVETGQELRRFEGHTEPLQSVAYSPDGRWALSTTDGPTIRLWDVESGKLLRLFLGHTDRVQHVTFSPDGRRVLSASHDGTMRLWDAETGQELRRFQGGTAPLECVAFSPDGRRALSSGQDGTLRLWDVEGGKELRRWREHTWLVCGVAFSPDGRRVASASLASVRLWDAESGQEICRFVGHEDMVWSVAFSPDGRQILSGGGGTFSGAKHGPGSDWALRLWSVPGADKPLNARPFAVLARDGKVQQTFATLAQAVAAAKSGDAVEILGNGPFVVDAEGVKVQKELKIRAGDGCRPVLKMAVPKPGQQRNKVLIEAWAPLTLEGLDFDRAGSDEEWGTNMAALYVDGGPLRMSNCRLLTRSGTHFLVWLKGVSKADIRNCLLGGETGAAIAASYCATYDRIAISNCIFARPNNAVLLDMEQLDAAAPLRVRLFHNTFASVPLHWNYRSITKRIEVEAEGNIIADHPAIVIRDTPRMIAWNEPVKKLDWAGKKNLYPPGAPLIWLHLTPATESASLDAWNRLWKKPEEGSRVGVPKFKGVTAPRWSTPAGEADSWRLMTDSPGKGEAENGRDLGADVDLVGPGPAYQRWKRTPEYQHWLKDTGRVQGGN